MARLNQRADRSKRWSFVKDRIAAHRAREFVKRKIRESARDFLVDDAIMAPHAEIPSASRLFTTLGNEIESRSRNFAACPIPREENG